MLSFTIFLASLLFLFLFLNPFANIKEEDTHLNSIHKIIVDSVSSEVGKLSIIPSAVCYDFNTADYFGNYLEISSGGRYTIYFSDAFPFSNAPNKIGGCAEAYSLAGYTTENMIIYEKLEQLKLDYENDYILTAQNLGITKNFIFNVKDEIGNEIVPLTPNNPKDISAGIEVRATEYPIRIIDKNGNIYEYILNVRAW